MDNPLNDPKYKELLAKMKDDIELESTKCAECSNLVYMGFKFCNFCGAPNKDYDPDYDLEEQDCSVLHKDAEDPKEFEGRLVFCGMCGQKISPKDDGLPLDS